MAIDLKSYYQSAQEAEREVDRVMNEMKAALDLDTQEGKAQALGMRPALDEAKKKAQLAIDLYIAIRDSTFISDGLVSRSGKMKRSIFDSLDPTARVKFIRQGGTVID